MTLLLLVENQRIVDRLPLPATAELGLQICLDKVPPFPGSQPMWQDHSTIHDSSGLKSICQCELSWLTTRSPIRQLANACFACWLFKRGSYWIADPIELQSFLWLTLHISPPNSREPQQLSVSQETTKVACRRSVEWRHFWRLRGTRYFETLPRN